MCSVICSYNQFWRNLIFIFVIALSARAADQTKTDINDSTPKKSPEESLVSLRDRLTSERSALIKKDVNAPAPPEKVEPVDLLARSTIIRSGGSITLVPKESIIYVPKEYMDRIGQDPTATILSWNDFIPLNRGWISCLELSYNQAIGKEPLPIAAIEKMKKYGNLIVATASGNPITVRSQKSKGITPVPSNTQPLEK
jgi:hypothetical protein